MKSLTPERWQQIDKIFAAALEIPPGARAALLDERCADDAELRREVEKLLRSADEAEGVIGESVTYFAEPVMADLRDHLDRQDLEQLPGGGLIGPYRVLELIGRGGMGAVYLAERADDQFEKQVALKLVKRGMDTDEVLHRFRYERQILAALEHPNIGRLYDGGAAEDGRPYLVMEYIAGEPVTTYCDERRLSVDARLRIFETICTAVQFAHRNLVIHRDLKPSNILVTADGTVKLLDFGIAKLLDPSRPDLAPQTRTEMRLLTPEYASPEQLDGGKVTTASDVYCLGVILFELLTGRRPSERRGRRTEDRFGLDTGRGRPSSSVVRPLRLDEAGASIPAAEIAALRGTTPERLRTRLRGDLDTITLKALAEEPERRYQSAEQLLADVQRYRRGLPVLARGESIGYRASKFVRRHRMVVSLSTAITVLVAGFVGTTFRQNQLLRQARFVAEARQGQAEDLIGFMFDDLRPKLVAIGQSDWLVEAASRAEAYFTAVPPEQLSDRELFRRTEQMRLFGNVRLDRGDVAGALESFQAAHALSEDLVLRDSTNPEWRLGLALDHFWLGNFSFQRGDFDAALEHFRAYRDHTARLVSEAPDDLQYRLELSYAYGNIGTVLEFMGDAEGALQEYLRSLEQKQALVDLDPEDAEFQSALATAFNKVAVIEQQQGDLRSALGHLRQELDVRVDLAGRNEADMPARRDLALSHIFLGELLVAMGEQPEALEHQLAAWEIQRELVRWDPANVSWRRGLATCARLAGLGLAGVGRWDEGLAAANESRQVLQQLLEQDPASADYRQELVRSDLARASVLLERDAAAAEAAARDALQGVATLRAEGELTAQMLAVEARIYIDLGQALAALDREADAHAAWQQALELAAVAEERSGVDQLPTRASALLLLGRQGEAGPLLKQLSLRGYRHPKFMQLLRDAG